MDIFTEVCFYQTHVLRLLHQNPRLKEYPLDVENGIYFIGEHFFEEWLNVNAVRQYCGLKNNNYSGRFRMYVGSTVREFIEEIRLHAAIYLMRHPDIKAYSIAFHIGYTYPESFSRAFKRRFGCSPMAFQQRHLQKDAEEKMSRSIVNRTEWGAEYLLFGADGMPALSYARGDGE